MTKEEKDILDTLEHNGQLTIREIMAKSKYKLDFTTVKFYINKLCNDQRVINVNTDKYEITVHGQLFNINSNPYQDLRDDAKFSMINLFIKVTTVILLSMAIYYLFM